MELADRIKSFEFLGDRLRLYHESSTDPELRPLVDAADSAFAENPWFTPKHIRLALNSLGKTLDHDHLTNWLACYRDRLLQPVPQRRVGVVMAGNIPAVGFHDFLCVLISGHKFIGRLSSSDARLIPALASVLIEDCHAWQHDITFTTGRLEGFDTVIATGSDNTSRYFEFYFGKYPNIIRKNRNSVAILDGSEDPGTLERVADDIMCYFGLGCRSVSKVFVPAGYDFSPLIKALGKYQEFTNHNKYCNNYDYSKSVFLVNQVPFTDAGCLLFREDPALASRIAVLHYEYYQSPGEVQTFVETNRDLIQCVVSNAPFPFVSVLPGDAQKPGLSDYADGVDTLNFLLA